MRGNPFAGAACMLQGLRLIGQPGLRRFVAIPLLVNSLLFAGLIWLGWHELETLTAWLEGWLPSWLSWLRWLLWPLFVLTALLIVFYGFSVVANTIAAPFNGLLAERVEQYLTGQTVDQSGSWQAVLKDFLPSILM
jgi:CysZ protein